MQLVILAAGRGTRMKSLTEAVPKPLLSISGTNLIEHKLSVIPAEIDEIIIIIGYLGEQIKAHFGNNFKGKNITYVEQKELNGTGGALFLVKDLIKGKFLVMMGDDIYNKDDVSTMIDNGWSILAKESEGKMNGAKIVVDQDKIIKEIIEGTELQKGDWNNAGMYLLGPEIFNYPLVPKAVGEKEFGLPQTIALAAKEIPIRIVPTKRWLQVSSPEDLERIEKVLEQR